MTPLGQAILQGCQDAVCCLLELGASPNKGDKLGRSILDLAVHTCNPELVAILLQVKTRQKKQELTKKMQADAEMEQKDARGNRPLDRAIALGSVEVRANYFCG